MDLGIPGLGPAVRIGMGGSAIVYRARQDRLERDVAVKILTDRDPSFLRRFDREARALGRLSRLPGIVTVHASGLTAEGEPYLILEFCPTSLQDRLYRDGAIEVAEACHLIARVAATMAEASETGIVHRDLKPANILLDADGSPLVSDFGIASVLGATVGHSTSIGFTPGYVAPETLRGRTGGPEIDVYAMGATLFHLVAGRAPFVDRVDGANLVALAATIDAEPVEDLRASGVPGPVCSIIESAMAKDPAARPTAAELAEALAGIDPGAADPAERGPTGEHRNPEPRHGPAPPVPGERPDRADRDADRPAPPPTHLGFAAADETGPAGAPPPTTGPAVGQPGAKPRVMPLVLLPAAIVLGLYLLASVLTRGDAEPSVLPPTTTGPTMTTLGVARTTGIPFGDRSADAPSPSTTAPATATLAELRARWQEQRAAIVADLTDRIRSDGSADGVIEGAGGFAIDRSSCGPGWSDRGGLADGTITIGIAYDEGPLASWGPLAAGLAAYFDWINANGGIGPDQLRIEPRFLTSGAPADTVTDAVADDDLFAVTTIWSGDGLEVNDLLNEACVPHALVMNGHPAWTDPEGHPWTTGLEMTYLSEAWLWVSLIDDWFHQPIDVAAVVMDNEFGRLYESGFREAAKASFDIADITIVRHDPAAADLDDELAELAADPPDVLIAMTAGNPCLLAITAAAEAGISDESTGLRLLPSHCRQPAAYLAPAGAAADGWVSLDGGTRDLTEDGESDPPFTGFVEASLEAADLDPTIEAHQRGFALHGWTWHQTLEIASQLPGGLTRSTFVLAQRALSSLDHPLLVDGVDLRTWGTADPSAIEGATVDVWELGAWRALGVVDVDGRTPACRWQAVGAC